MSFFAVGQTHTSFLQRDYLNGALESPPKNIPNFSLLLAIPLTIRVVRHKTLRRSLNLWGALYVTRK